MPLEALRTYLEEKKLINTDNLSLLQNYRIGIDATHWLNRNFVNEDLSQAIGGCPLTLESTIQAQISLYSKAGITPVWIFDGLIESHHLPSIHFDGNQYERCWNLYSENKFEEARKTFLEFSKGLAASYSTLNHAFDMLLSLEQEVIRAPLKNWPQLRQFLESNDPLVHAVYGPLEILVHGANRLIIDIDFVNEKFYWVDLQHVFQGIDGENKLKTFIGACFRVTRGEKSFEAVLSNEHENLVSRFPSLDSYVEIVDNSYLNHISKETIPYPYFKMSLGIVRMLCLGLLSVDVVYALIEDRYKLLLPYSFPKLIGFIELSVVNVLDNTLSSLSRFSSEIQKKTAATLIVNNTFIKKFPITMDQHFNTFNPKVVPQETLVEFFKKELPSPSTTENFNFDITLNSLLKLSVDKNLVFVEPSKLSLDQVYIMTVYTAAKTLKTFYSFSSTPTFTNWGQVVVNMDSQFTEEAMILCYLLKHRYFDDLFESENFEISFLTQVFSVLKCEHVHQQWIGPVDRELFEFNIVVTLLNRTLNQLCQAILCNLFVKANRKYAFPNEKLNHLVKVVLKLPWRQEPNAIMGILLKAFLTEPSYRLKYRFPSCKSLKKSLEKGFAFWNSFYSSFQNVNFGDELKMSLAITKADQFLKKFELKIKELSD